MNPVFRVALGWIVLVSGLTAFLVGRSLFYFIGSVFLFHFLRQILKPRISDICPQRAHPVLFAAVLLPLAVTVIVVSVFFPMSQTGQIVIGIVGAPMILCIVYDEIQVVRHLCRRRAA